MQTIQLKRIVTKIICDDKMNRNNLLREWFIFALWIVSMSCFLFRIEQKKIFLFVRSYLDDGMRCLQNSKSNRQRWRATHLFVGQFFATTLLANLMTLVVTARCTIAAVVFLLTTDAFTAALTLLFCLKRSKKEKKNIGTQYNALRFVVRNSGSDYRVAFNRMHLFLHLFRVKIVNFFCI